MAKGKVNIQDQFLNQVRKERVSVTVSLSRGEKITGVVNSFDQFVVILKADDGIPALLYKQGIESIKPTNKDDIEKIELF